MGTHRRRIVSSAAATVLAFVLAVAAAQGPAPAAVGAYAGTYVGDGLELRLEAVSADGGYVGTLQHGAARYPVVGEATAAGLTGSFESGGHHFGFVATLREPTLTFTTGGAIYTLTRRGPPPEPLGVAADVPNPCLLLPLVPAAAAAGPPPGIGPGTRLVYYAASASIPGERTQLVQDQHGVWVDRATGQRWSEQDVPGPAGAGYLVAQVAYLDAQRVALSQRHYLIDPTSGQAMLMPSGAAGTVSHAGCAGDAWVHPLALAALPDMEQSGTRVIRMPYQLGDRTFDAIRIQTATANGFTAYVYDLPSGLLLYFGSSTVGAGGLTPQAGGTSAPGRGSTLLVNGWLRDVQQVEVPWRDAPPPAWVAQFAELDYQGTYTVMTPGSPTFPLPIQERVSVVARGAGWVQASADRWMYSPQQAPVGHERTVSVHGPATVGGLWIAPEALARLTQGQVVERCSVVGVTTSVSAVGADTVTLSEVGPLHRQDLVYDRRSGVLVGSTLVQQVGGTPNVAELRLVGGPR